MESEPLHRMICSLRQAAEPATLGFSDSQFLERFVAQRDESAYELLLWRHGPMVLVVCRRLLPRMQDAEDAFQATFLALARKAASIANREVAGTWLYRVAYRVALRIRLDRAKWTDCEQPEVEHLVAESMTPLTPGRSCRWLIRLCWKACHSAALAAVSASLA